MKDYLGTNNYFHNLSNNDLNEESRGTKIRIETVSGQDMVSIETIGLIKETIHCYTEYAKIVEQEHTERKRIMANLKAIKYQIDAQKEVCLKALDKHYEERRELFEDIRKAIRKATEDGDKEMLVISGNLLLSLYDSKTNNQMLLGVNSIMDKLK